MLAFPFRAFPAAARAVAIALAISALCWSVARLRFQDSRPLVFLLGDSNIGNYRFAAGDRLEDVLQKLEPGSRVENWAEPGSTPLDFYMQYCRGALLAGRPKKVVIALDPCKFLWLYDPHRLDEGGKNLRWFPLSKAGWRLWNQLTPRERNVALVERAGLPFFALCDAVRDLWIRNVQDPWQRRKMLAAGDERRRRIEAKSADRAKQEAIEPMPGDAELDTMQLARDGAFLLSALRADGVETRVMLMPIGNPELIRKTCPPVVIAKHDTLLARMRSWLDRRQIEYVDFNAPVEMAHFPDRSWDDRDHLKDPAAFAYLAERVHRSLEQPQTAGIEVLPPPGPDAP